MAKKINIQKDVESRKVIQSELPPVVKTEESVNLINSIQENAESQTCQESPDNTTHDYPEQKKKTRRETKRDTEEV